jgi:AsmA protein
VLDAPAFEGHIETGTFNLRALMSGLGFAYAPAGPKAMTAASLAARLTTSPARTELRDLVFSLDGSTLKGAATMTAGVKPAWDATLSVDTVDVDRYLPAAAAAAASSAADPYASLRELVARVRLDAQRLRAFGLQFSNVSASVTARDGLVNVTPIRGEMYGGRGDLAARLDVRGRVPAYHLEGRLAGVSVQPLLTDTQSISALSGTGDISLQIHATAADPARLTEALEGRLAMSVRDGRIEGADFLKLVTQARAMADQLRGRPAAAQSDPADRTKFTRLSASVTIDRGIARNGDLKLEAPDLRAAGAGTIDLVRERIDYVLRASSDQAGNVAVPIAIEGPFAAPAYRVEAAAALRDAAKQELKKQLEKRGLKGLFKKP